MKPIKPQDVDTTIDAALSSEPLRPVPQDLDRRITNRLRIAVLLQRERRRFRYGMAMGGLVMGAILICAGLLAFLADVPGLFKHGVPGGMGYLDYVTTYMALSWSNAGSSLTLALTPIVAVALLLTILPLCGLAARRALGRVH